MITHKEMAQRLKQLRKNTNLTQAQVSQRAKISRSNYSAYEEGRAMPSVNTCLSLAELYGLTLDQLLLTRNKPAAEHLMVLMTHLSPREQKAVKILLFGDS